jgi:hypothetical protein
LGVGQLSSPGEDPKALAFVRGTNVGCSEHTPLRIEPVGIEVGEDVREPVLDVTSDVLEEGHRSPCFPEDPSDLGPEVSGVSCSELLPGLAERLTGVSGSEDIHASTPRATVEGSEVVPNRRTLQGRFFHPRHEGLRGSCFPLDVTHGSKPASESQVESEVESAVSGA